MRLNKSSHASTVTPNWPLASRSADNSRVRSCNEASRRAVVAMMRCFKVGLKFSALQAEEVPVKKSRFTDSQIIAVLKQAEGGSLSRLFH